MDEKRLILAFDCASHVGSVAVLRDGVVVSRSRDDERNPSRAEELLFCVRDVLDDAGVTMADVSLIAAATGPGSYSGIRIGLATAAGLAKALGIEWLGVSLLQALATKAASHKILSAIPIGKADVAWQEFEFANELRRLGDPRQNSEEVFAREIEHLNVNHVVVPSTLAARMQGHTQRIGVLDAGTNLAELVGEFAATHPKQTSPIPIYLRNESYAGTGF